VAFSGHGIDRQGRAFLLPADATLNDDPDLLEDTSIGVARIRRLIGNKSIQQVLVLLDACRNDPGGRAEAANLRTEAFNLDFRNQGITAFATLYAASLGQRAWESSRERRGYFMWMLERALSGEAANERGEVTLLSAIRYVQERVPKQVALDLGAGRKQLPVYQLEGFQPDALVLSMSPIIRPVITGVDTCEDTWQMIRATQSRETLLEFLKEFPNCGRASSARVRLKELEAPRVSQPVVPPVDLDALLKRANQQYETKNYTAALPLYRQAADAGNGGSMRRMGYMYDMGYGVSQDYAEAMRWYRKAADARDADAMNNIGYLTRGTVCPRTMPRRCVGIAKPPMPELRAR
jgi:hypothetical protein